jgi:ATP-dependent Lon protease
MTVSSDEPDRPAESAVVHIPDALAILPLRDGVVFPLTSGPILVAEERSLAMMEEVRRTNRLVGIVAQKNDRAVSPQPADLYQVGTLALVRPVTKVSRPNHPLQIHVAGIERFRIVDFTMTEPYLVARIQLAADTEEKDERAEILTQSVKALFRQLVELSDELPDPLADGIQMQSSGRHVAYLAASMAPLAVEVRQQLLELESVSEKLDRLVGILKHEIAVRRVVREVTAETASEINKTQREAILRKQMDAIQRQLGESEPERAAAHELSDRLAKRPLSPEARKEAERELARLERTPSISPEHGMIRTYLEWIEKLPWGKTTGGAIDEARARVVLDEDHYDLEKVKERIVEYLAVKALRQERAVDQPGAGREGRFEPILCFVGPPGVGKTSIGQSIARAMDRKFTHLSLGGVDDEAEIRGHRRTYLGAMPGRILQGIARAEAADPIFMLDEVDKLARSFHGDPSAALLEVLDPAQNHAFMDHYLGVPFDLSSVLFICTANTTHEIPPALLDRMEVLSLPGYTDAEKRHIAERYLLPRQRVANGLRDGEVKLDDAVLPRIIRDYTREPGVRSLERELGTVLRKGAQRVRGGAPTPLVVDVSDLHAYLGPPRFFDEVAERIDRPGVATGLAWTPAGGDILFVEASLMPADRSALTLTGMIGEVMRESAQAALSWLRANAERIGIEPVALRNKEVHVHVPAGAIPKDGPSAGLTILIAIASHALGRAIRDDVATTGEITLRGKVLPVGGIKEKVLAAHRAGLKVVVLPKRNQGALEDVPDEVRDAIEFVLVESVDEALAVTLGVEAQLPEEMSVPLH